MAGTVDCIQANGSHQPVEEWAFRSYLRGEVTDPLVIRTIRGAVRCIDEDGHNVTPDPDVWRGGPLLPPPERAPEPEPGRGCFAPGPRCGAQQAGEGATCWHQQGHAGTHESLSGRAWGDEA